MKSALSSSSSPSARVATKRPRAASQSENASIASSTKNGNGAQQSTSFQPPPPKRRVRTRRRRSPRAPGAPRREGSRRTARLLASLVQSEERRQHAWRTALTETQQQSTTTWKNWVSEIVAQLYESLRTCHIRGENARAEAREPIDNELCEKAAVDDYQRGFECMLIVHGYDGKQPKTQMNDVIVHHARPHLDALIHNSFRGEYMKFLDHLRALEDYARDDDLNRICDTVANEVPDPAAYARALKAELSVERTRLQQQHQKVPCRSTAPRRSVVRETHAPQPMTAAR